MTDLVSRIMEYEDPNHPITEEEVTNLFQELLDTGMWEHLQGSYQRTLFAMVRAGIIKNKGAK